MDNSANLLPNCPWGDAIVDLHSVALSSKEKDWLASQINGNIQTRAELTAKYKISRKVLSKYARMSRNGIIMHGKTGRPRALDAESIESITAYINVPPPKSIYEVFEKLLQESEKTYKRRVSDEGEAKCMSKRSKYRYYRQFS